MSLLYHLKSFFNAFELIVFIRHFCDMCILYVFVIYTNGFIVTVIEGGFLRNNEGKPMRQSLYKQKKFDFFQKRKVVLRNF